MLCWRRRRQPPRITPRCAPGLETTPERLLATLLDPQMKVATSTPKNDPGGDYAWAMFAKADAVKQGSRATLEGKAIKIGDEPGSLAIPPAASNSVVWLFREQRADIFISYCTNSAGVAAAMPGACRRRARRPWRHTASTRHWRLTMPKKIDVDSTATVKGARYPAPYQEPCEGRFRRILGDAAGLTQFGANLMRLPPNTWSSQRHWHSDEDEFIYVLEGELILVTDLGEETLKAGDCAGFKAGDPNGHHLQNRSSNEALYLEVGSRRPDGDEVTYPDIDLRAVKGREGYAHVNGERYPDAKPRNPATGK